MVKRRNKKTLPLLERVRITGMAAGGRAIARADDKVVFVPFAAPGDVVDVQVKKSRKNYLEGVISQAHHWSEDRIEPFCGHFGICGGCQWQHLPYEKQLDHKEQQCIDSLQRIARLDMDAIEVTPIAGSEKTTFYRNKLEFTFSNRRWLSDTEISSGRKITDTNALGFHIPGLFDKVLDIKKCWLQADPSNEIRLAVKALALDQQLSFYDLRSNEGLLRNLIVRNTPEGEVMVLVVFGQNRRDDIDQVMQWLGQQLPSARSLACMVNEKKNSSIADLHPAIHQGNAFLTEHMEGLSFQVGPKSFYQTNSLQAVKLYSVVRDFARLEGHELVYDLYTGTGTIACFMAVDAKKVLGIEYVEEAVEHARHNARINGLNNTRFLAGDMAQVFNHNLIRQYGRPHVIITDPPRAGMHPAVIKQILESGAGRIVYVSCNPATQARDVELLSEKYRPAKSQAVDMFPHTHHVENVVLMVKRMSLK